LTWSVMRPGLGPRADGAAHRGVTRRAGAHVVVADIQGRQAEETALRVAAETGRRTLAAPIPEHSRALLAHIGTACDRMHAWKVRGCPVLDVE